MNQIIDRIWAKSSPYQSIRTHAMCTGICAQVFLSSKSSARILSYLSECFDSDEKHVICLISYLASVHDIGKVHPAFQSKDKICFQELKNSAPGSFEDGPVEAVVLSFRHEHYSAEVLRRIWKTKGCKSSISMFFASVIAQHHQKPRDRMSLVAPRNKTWIDLQNDIEQILSDAFLQQAELIKPSHVDAVGMLISSIIILMDWAASSALFTDAETMTLQMIRNRAEYVLRLLGLISDAVFPTVRSFTNLFPSILHPRPLQEACEALSDIAPLSIIEAPMGEGKTEAAFYLAARICKAMGGRGIYMALPSQATSNQIHTRLNTMLSDLGYGNARLLHGTAFLMQDLPDTYTTEDEEIAAKWTRPSRMGFLGANAVGTVDQAMSGVLRSRFSMLRLAGLSNKVLIIDEIHAYDQYMSQIIETLLAWCRDLHIPVILLSATMRIAQKQRYLSCFSSQAHDLSGEGYPLLTQVIPGGEVRQIKVDASANYHYLFHPVRMEYDASVIANMALRAVDKGGCVAVMVNTVRHAQEIYQSLWEQADDQVTIMLFHSRFTLERRGEIEKKCVSLFGRDRAQRPMKGVLVATQVVEQSIDLDFDGMISELAPVDLLLQRAGRLHRHRENKRPSGFLEPVLNVLLPSENISETLDRRYGVSSFVYDPFLLYNTEQQLKEDRVIRVPEDIRTVVETVYSTITDENRDAWLKQSLRGLLETTKAKGCTWPFPDEDTFFPLETTFYYDISDSEDGFEASSEASTRLGDDSIRIAFCDETSFDKFVKEGIDKSDQISIYLNSVSVRLEVTAMEGSDAAYKITKGKLAGIWILRGKSMVDLNTVVIRNDRDLGILWEMK